MIHELKIAPKFFQDIVNGIKNFEIRKNDRKFNIGDILVLSEIKEDNYTGNQVTVKIENILTHNDFPEGIPVDYVVMNIKLCNEWRPLVHDIYYRVDIEGDIVEEVWEETTYDYSLLAIGNCFKDRIQASIYINYFKNFYEQFNVRYK